MTAFNDGAIDASQASQLLEPLIPDPNIFSSLKRMLKIAEQNGIDEEQTRERELERTMRGFQSEYFRTDGHLSTVQEESRDYY